MRFIINRNNLQWPISNWLDSTRVRHFPPRTSHRTCQSVCGDRPGQLCLSCMSDKLPCIEWRLHPPCSMEAHQPSFRRSYPELSQLVQSCCTSLHQLSLHNRYTDTAHKTTRQGQEALCVSFWLLNNILSFAEYFSLTSQYLCIRIPSVEWNSSVKDATESHVKRTNCWNLMFK